MDKIRFLTILTIILFSFSSKSIANEFEFNSLHNLNVFYKGSRLEQPADPCDVLNCPWRIQLGTDGLDTRYHKSLAARINNMKTGANFTSDGGSVLDLSRSSTVVNEKNISVNDWKVIRACHHAFSKFVKDGIGRTLDYDYHENWKEKCFESINDINPRLALLISSTLVQLTIGNSHCNGALLSKDVILTARHCFLSSDSLGIHDNLDNDKVSQSKVSGVSIDTGYWEKKIKGVIYDPFDSDINVDKNLFIKKRDAPSSFDFIVLKIEGGDRCPLIRFTHDSVSNKLEKKQRLLVASFENKKEFIRILIDKSYSCIVQDYDPNKGYLHHYCQTMPGFSGTPIFAFNPPDKVEIIGLQSGAAGLMYPNKKPNLTGNEAVVIPSKLVNGLFKRTCT